MARVLLSTSLILMALTGCGQKGPLYLPDDPEPPVYVASPCDAPNAPCRKDASLPPDTGRKTIEITPEESVTP